MKVIGLTGGIGSGKSTVARVFERLSVPVFYADEVAKTAYADESIREKVIALFGEEVFEDGKLNKSLLATKAFASSELLSQLNAVIHPYVAEQWKKW